MYFKSWHTVNENQWLPYLFAADRHNDGGGQIKNRHGVAVRRKS